MTVVLTRSFIFIYQKSVERVIDSIFSDRMQRILRQTDSHAKCGGGLSFTAGAAV